MIWHRTLMCDVMSFRVSCGVDAFTLEAARDAFEEHMRREFAAYALDKLVVKVDTRDVVVHVGDRDAPSNTLPVTTAWRPETHDIELVGGPADGDVVAFHRAPHDRYRVPVPDGGMIAEVDAATPALRIADYECTGWNETTRRWVYGAKRVES